MKITLCFPLQKGDSQTVGIAISCHCEPKGRGNLALRLLRRPAMAGLLAITYRGAVLSDEIHHSSTWPYNPKYADFTSGFSINSWEFPSKTAPPFSRTYP